MSQHCSTLRLYFGLHKPMCSLWQPSVESRAHMRWRSYLNLPSLSPAVNVAVFLKTETQTFCVCAVSRLASNKVDHRPMLSTTHRFVKCQPSHGAAFKRTTAQIICQMRSLKTVEEKMRRRGWFGLCCFIFQVWEVSFKYLRRPEMRD